MDIGDLIIFEKKITERKSKYMDFPDDLSQDLIQYLTSHKINKLYCHQAEMFNKAIEGNNIVITTSTASGKTLSFLLPVIQEILNNPLARAIFIYPTKALTSDQYKAITPILEYFGHNRISAGVYDGDTPVSERSRIRKNANIILTNPEMLNNTFLPNHSKYGFDFIFSNLKYIIIDELHTYRGAFGSHLANIFRRIQRVCRYYNASPQFLCSTATIANPTELASEICGKDFTLINNDGSPSPEKRYVFIQPPTINGDWKVQVTTVATQLIPELVENHNSFIAFTKSRRNVEIVLKESQDKLSSDGMLTKSLSNRISGYRGGYTPLERKAIENKMASGVLQGLISTNVLELGIDIGKIDSTVLIGYPGTRASFWQQTGRSGRSGNECTNYLILDNFPFDQYIAVEPDWLFAGSTENAVIDKNNLLIQLAHIRSAAAEIPLSLDDIALFPDLGEVIPVLMQANELTNQNGKFMWSGKSYPAGDYSLRNIDKSKYKLVNQANNGVIAEMDEMQAYREIHKDAIYMHDGAQYQVLELDLESKTAYAIPSNVNYYTIPSSITNIKIIHGNKEIQHERVNISFGDVNVDEQIHMFKKLQFHNHQNLGSEEFNQPLSKDYDTESTWLIIPSNITQVYSKLINNNYFAGICYAIKNAAMMVTMTEQNDIDVNTSNVMNQNNDDINTSDKAVFIYDKYVGGLGYAEKIYDYIPNIIGNVIKMVEGCSCKDGCPACIGDYKLDKKIVLWGLKNFIEESEAPSDIKDIEETPRTEYRKPFIFDELPQKWTEFCDYINKNGDAYTTFLSYVSDVSIEDNILVLILDSSFYREWVMQESNKRSIINIVRHATETPPIIDLAIEVVEQNDNTTNTRNKLEKRYENLL